MTTLAPSFLIGSSSLLQTRRTTIKALVSLNFVKKASPSLSHLKQMDNVVTALAPSLLNGSSSFFQVSRTTIKNLDEFEL